MSETVDLVDLDDISDQSILSVVERRFHRNEIYSSIGTILIAVNPYKTVNELYNQQILNEFAAEDPEFDPSVIFKFEKPHVWMISKNAYYQLKLMKISQAIVISGESGAGKTETTKKCLQLLSTLAGRHHTNSEDRIENKILATNPVLESFGNAKTARNNNSSRFGKWIRINYNLDSDSDLQMIGGSITQYLLEKSRVVTHAPDERNYHIFYQLCASGIMDLQPPASYRYLRFSKNMKIPGVDDKLEFQTTYDAMIHLGFTDLDRETVFASLKGILLLGNIIFTEDPATNVTVISPDYQPLVTNIAKIFGWNAETFSHKLITRTITVRKEISYIQLNSSQAQDGINALAKEIYGRIFNYIVTQANRSLSAAETSSNQSLVDNELSIGLLDIFGFEKFKFNSFEQLCINYANEKLQQYFVTFVLKKEQDLYRAEGVEFNCIISIDNSDVLYLFEGKKDGVFARLDDEIKLPKATDESFLKKLEVDHNNSKLTNRRFFKDVKMQPTQFEIRHFAGIIRYDCQGFLEKNRDKLYENLEELFYLSSNLRFRELMIYDGVVEGEGGLKDESSRKFNFSGTLHNTISTRFQSQLTELIEMLNLSQPHFIKCIKPNNLKQENLFEKDTVLSQLKYSGVIEAISIRKSGYPTRRALRLFWRSYWMLSKFLSRQILNNAENDFEKCKLVISSFPQEKISISEIKVGKSLIFLKSNTLVILEDLKKKKRDFILLKLQSYCRMILARRLLRTMKETAQKIELIIELAQSSTSSNNQEKIQLIPHFISLLEESNEKNLPLSFNHKLHTELRRLQEINECLKKLEYYAQRQIPNESEDTQILQEYQSLTDLLEICKRHDISSPLLVSVTERLNLLQERAELIKNLLLLVDTGEEAAITGHLRKIHDLAQKYGKFCSDEIHVAESRLVLIRNDNKVLSSILNFLNQQYSNEIHAYQAKHENGNLAVIFEDCNKVLSDYMYQSVHNPNAELWQSNVFNSSSVRLVIPFVLQLMLFHDNYVAQNWNETVNLLYSIRNSFIPEKRTAPELTEIRTLFLAEAKLASNEFIYKYILPKIFWSLSHSKIVSLPLASSNPNATGVLNDHVDLNKVDNSLLINIIDEMKGFLLLQDDSTHSESFEKYSNTDSLLVDFVRLLERFLDIRTNFVDELWEMVILLSETVENKRFRLQLLHEWYYSMKSFDSTIDESFYYDSNIILDPIEGFLRPLVDQDLMDRSDKESAQLFKKIFDLLDTEIQFLKRIAFDRFIINKIKHLIVADCNCQDADHAGIRTDTELYQITLDYGFKLISSPSYGQLNTISSSLKFILEGIQLIIISRKDYGSFMYSAIIQSWEEGKFDVYLQFPENSSKINIFSVSGSESLSLLKSVLIQLLQNACKSYFTDCILSQIKLHRILLDDIISSVNMAESIVMEPPKQNLEWNTCLKRIQKLNATVAEILPDFVEAMASFTNDLLQLRTKFRWQNSFFDVEGCSTSLINLQTRLEEVTDYFEFRNIRETLSSELSEMSLVLQCKDCMKAINHVLTFSDQPQEMLEYLIPYVPVSTVPATAATASRLRTVSASVAPITSPTPLRLKSLSFDLGLSSPLIGSQISSTQIEDVLKSDGFMLHDDALETENFESVCNIIREFKEIIDMEEKELPTLFVSWTRSIEGIKLIRECIQKGEWMIALRILQELENSNLIQNFTLLEKEISTNKDHIYNYAVITCCLNALSKTQPTGLIGQGDFKNVSTELLEEAVKFCQSLGRPSKRAEILFNAVLTMLDLRKAQKLGDWSEIRAVLAKAYSENIGAGMTDICFAEVNRAIIERDNYDGIQGLKSALVNEEMLTHDSMLDINQISTKELATAVNKIASMPEDTRGLVLKALYGLADTVLKARKAVQQKNWYVVENLLPVLRENSESLQNELDSKEKGGNPNVQRKTMFRTSSFHRGTILNNKDKRLMSAETTSSANLTRSSIWEEFTEVSQSIKRELKAIEHHFAIVELEKQLNEALTSGGIRSDVNGTIDKTGIEVEELKEAIDQATNLEISQLSLPKHLKISRKVAMLILDIRQGVLNDNWDGMSSLIEETLDNDFSTMPESCRIEIQVVRREVENKWIVTNLSSALMTGRLTGSVNDANLKDVSHNHLSSYITTAKSLHPFTDEAFKLIASAEKIMVLREIFSPNSTEKINWSTVKKAAKEIFDDVEKNKSLHKIILPEVKLILDVAEDRIIRDYLEQALSSGAPTGEPGRLIVSNVSTYQLEKAYQQAVRSSLKTDYAKLLLSICRTIQRLREVLIRAEMTTGTSNREISVDSWKTIKALLQEIEDLQKQNQSEEQLRSCWDIVSSELDLINKHAFVEDLRNSLIETAIKASHIYSERHNLNLQIELTKYELHSLELKNLCTELEGIIQFALNITFSSDYLQKYIACATTLRLYRTAILDGNWEQLEILIKDNSFQSNLYVLTETKQELQWILCELHNNLAIKILRSALESPLAKTDANSIVETDIDDLYTKEWDLKMLRGLSFSNRNEQLEKAINDAKAYKITSKIANQWLECCQNMFLLRSSLERRENHKVAQALRWFRSNARTLPNYIRLEAQRAYVIHQNDLLLNGLSQALRRGKPVGRCGAVNTSLIETEQIEDLLKQAKDISPRLPEVDELIAAANIALVIRVSLKSKNIAALNDIIADLSNQETPFSLLIVDEIAVAKGELDNEISIRALTKSLKSFEDTESKTLDLTFLRSSHMNHMNADNLQLSSSSIDVDDRGTTIASEDNLTPENLLSVEDLDTLRSYDLVDMNASPSLSPNKRFNSSILESFSPLERRYSFANKHSANIDLETIDVEILDYGLRVAEDHGIYSEKARRLYNTVQLIKSLRLALKNSEWYLLEEILNNSQYDENINVLYDELASKEIQTLRSQLLMRTAIVDLSKALKIGWAQCNHGIVDTSRMKNDLLLNAIEKADHCINELSNHSHSNNSKMDSSLSIDNEPSITMIEENEAIKNDQHSKHVGRKKSVQFAEDVKPLNSGFQQTNLKQQASKSSIEEQVKLLISSAKLIYKIRDILSTGNIELAGQLAEEGLNKHMLHYTVIEELKLYSKEINTALLSMKLIESCKESINNGKIQPLEYILKAAYDKEIHFSSDLGIIFILMKAEEKLQKLLLIRENLVKAGQSYDIYHIKDVIFSAVQNNYQDQELKSVRKRLEILLFFRKKFIYHVMKWIFQNNGKETFADLLSLARELDLLEHPLTHFLQFLIQCNPNLLSFIKVVNCFTSLFPDKKVFEKYFSEHYISTICKGSINFPFEINTISLTKYSSHFPESTKDEIEEYLSYKSIYMAYIVHGLVTHSIQQKRLYYQLPSSINKFRLENYPNLRSANDFSYRMNIISEELRKSFLFYTDQIIPCSLTRLSPQLSGIAIIIFGQIIRGIEKNLFSFMEILVKKLIILGRKILPLRDEILIQIVKQLRNHPLPEKRKKSVYNPFTSASSSSSQTYSGIVNKLHQQQQMQQYLQQQQQQLMGEENVNDDNLQNYVEAQEQKRKAVLSLWKVLMICLYYFPPSMMFESYLELYLWQQYDDVTNLLSVFLSKRSQNLSSDGDQKKTEGTTSSSPSFGEISNECEYYFYKNIRAYIMRCIRYLHRSVLLYGYSRPISVDQFRDPISKRNEKSPPTNGYIYSLLENDLSIETLKLWLQNDENIYSILVDSSVYYPSSKTSQNSELHSSVDPQSGVSIHPIRIKTFEHLFDPSLPHFQLGESFKDFKVNHNQNAFHHRIKTVFETQCLQEEMFTKEYLNDPIIPILLPNQQEEDGSCSNFTEANIDFDNYYHIYLLSSSINLLTEDPAFQKLEYPLEISFSPKETPKSSDIPSIKLQNALPTVALAAAAAVQERRGSSLPLTSPPQISTLLRLRGTREDWIARFRLFYSCGLETNINLSNPAAVGGIKRTQNITSNPVLITKTRFCNALASTINHKSKNDDLLIDRLDRDIFYFLLFGKKVSNRSVIVREYRNDSMIFHYLLRDEQENCELRRTWLNDHISVPDSISELFLSQLQTSDLFYAAEKFWDTVIVKMSKDCLQFPFLHSFDSSAVRDTSTQDEDQISKEGKSTHVEGQEIPNLQITLERPAFRRMSSRKSFTSSSPSPAKNSSDELTINWEIYREIILTGMKKYVELFIEK